LDTELRQRLALIVYRRKIVVTICWRRKGPRLALVSFLRLWFVVDATTNTEDKQFGIPAGMMEAGMG